MFRPVFTKPFQLFDAGAAAAFSPLDIAGLQFWLDFSDITTLYQDAAKTTPVTADGDVIGAAADKSGNGRDHTQATTSKKPLYKVGIQNGLSVGRFDGTDDALTATISVNQPYTALFAWSTTINSGLNELWRAGISIFRMNTPLWNLYAGVDAAGLAYAISTFAATCAVYNGASSIQYKNLSTTNTGNPGTAAFTNPGLGGTIGGRYFPGDLGEFLFYSSALSLANITLLFGYLNTKWSIY